MPVNKYWFKPKKYGLGAEPTTWEGWVLTIGYVVAVMGAVFYYIPEKTIDFYWFMGLSTLLLIYISKQKTDGEWKWRWGKKST